MRFLYLVLLLTLFASCCMAMKTNRSQISSEHALNGTGGNIGDDDEVNMPKIIGTVRKEEESVICMRKIEKSIKQIQNMIILLQQEARESNDESKKEITSKLGIILEELESDKNKFLVQMKIHHKRDDKSKKKFVAKLKSISEDHAIILEILKNSLKKPLIKSKTLLKAPTLKMISEENEE